MNAGQVNGSQVIHTTKEQFYSIYASTGRLYIGTLKGAIKILDINVFISNTLPLII
jgi:hypothetical protein